MTIRAIVGNNNFKSLKRRDNEIAVESSVQEKRSREAIQKEALYYSIVRCTRAAE